MHKIIKRALAGFAALALALTAALAVTASPAQAAGPCNNGWLCFYDTGSGDSLLYSISPADTIVGGCNNMNSTVNNRTSYINNKSQHQWRTYSDAGCVGTNGAIYGYSAGFMDTVHNNNISSYKRIN